MGGDPRDGRGQSLVELALLLPFLLWVAAGIVDFGRIYHYDGVVIGAARTGARAAADVRNSDGAVKQAVVDDAAPVAIPLTDVTITVSPAGARAPGSTVTVGVVYSFSPITPLVGALFPEGKVTISRSATMVAF